MTEPRIAKDPYPQDLAAEQSAAWHDGFAIEPSDTDELPFITRDLYVGISGDVHVLLTRGQDLVFKNAQQGFYLGLRVRKVFETGTTAKSLIGTY
jgi:hypothetical protein